MVTLALLSTAAAVHLATGSSPPASAHASGTRPGVTHGGHPYSQVLAPTADPSVHATRIPVSDSQVPEGLRATSCILFHAGGASQHPVVFIDPGHGGPDPGASGPTSAGATIEEKDVTLPVALRLEESLVSAGYEVVLSRTGDASVARLSNDDLQGGLLTPDGARREVLARIACANAAQASLLLSIHFDAFQDPSVGGAETAYDDARPFSDRNQRFASLVQQDLVGAFRQAGWEVPDRGVGLDSQTGPALTQRGDQYGHLLLLGPEQDGWVDHPSQMPGCLVEPLFLTRPSEADVATSAEGQRAMAAGLAQAIEAFLPAR